MLTGFLLAGYALGAIFVGRIAQESGLESKALSFF